jgi:hypothetical protein
MEDVAKEIIHLSRQVSEAEKRKDAENYVDWALPQWRIHSGYAHVE